MQINNSTISNYQYFSKKYKNYRTKFNQLINQLGLDIKNNKIQISITSLSTNLIELDQILLHPQLKKNAQTIFQL